MANSKSFKKGGTDGNKPGRKKGSLNKTTKAVKDVIEDVFNELQEDKVANLHTWALNNTTEFYKLASKLLPLQLTGKDGEAINITIPILRIGDK